jgi:hypothetical protein
MTAIRNNVKVACIHCKKSNKKCDECRPCGRCKRLNKETCVDAPRKKKRVEQTVFYDTPEYPVDLQVLSEVLEYFNLNSVQ